MGPDSLSSGSSGDEHTPKPGPSKSHYFGNMTRLQRSQAEKQRRDRFNSHISELATLVPLVKNASKTLDKVSILRLSAAHMRLNLSCLNSKYFKSKLPELSQPYTRYYDDIEKAVESFIVATTFSGVILYCSKNIEEFLGFQNIDVMGHPIVNYIHYKEIAYFKRKLKSFLAHYKIGDTRKNKKSINVRIKQRPLPRSSEVKFRKMAIKFSIYENESPGDELKDSKALKRLQKSSKDKDFGKSAIVLMLITPAFELPKIDLKFTVSEQDIYYTMHGLQGEIIESDHRISTITGYMPRDVLGKSAYEFIHAMDIPIASFAQRAMFVDGTGLITYRLKILDSSYIYLQSKGQLFFKDSSNEISHFICCNILLSNEEGKIELKKFKDRFVPQIPAEEAENERRESLNAALDAKSSSSSSQEYFCPEYSDRESAVNSTYPMESARSSIRNILFQSVDADSPMSKNVNDRNLNLDCRYDLHLATDGNNSLSECRQTLQHSKTTSSSSNLEMHRSSISFSTNHPLIIDKLGAANEMFVADIPQAHNFDLSRTFNLPFPPRLPPLSKLNSIHQASSDYAHYTLPNKQMFAVQSSPITSDFQNATIRSNNDAFSISSSNVTQSNINHLATSKTLPIPGDGYDNPLHHCNIPMTHGEDQTEFYPQAKKQRTEHPPESFQSSCSQIPVVTSNLCTYPVSRSISTCSSKSIMSPSSCGSNAINYSSVPNVLLQPNQSCAEKDFYDDIDLFLETLTSSSSDRSASSPIQLSQSNADVFANKNIPSQSEICQIENELNMWLDQ